MTRPRIAVGAFLAFARSRAAAAAMALPMGRRAAGEGDTALGRRGPGVVTLDGAGRITAANEAFLAMIGLPAAAVVGADIRSPLWSPAGPDDLEEVHVGGSEPGVAAEEWTLRRSTGEMFVASVVPAALPGGGLVATVTDRSAERARERALLRERDHAAAAADLASEDLDRARQWAERLSEELRQAQSARADSEQACELMRARAEMAAALAAGETVEERACLALDALAGHARANGGAIYLGAEAPRLAAAIGDRPHPEMIDPLGGEPGCVLAVGEAQLATFVPGQPASNGDVSGPDGWELHVPLVASGEPVGLVALGASSGPPVEMEVLAELSRDVGRALAQEPGLAAADNALLGVVSREMRTPLTSVSGYLQDALEVLADDDDEEGLVFLEAAHRNARRLEQLVDDLMTLSDIGRKGGLGDAPIDLAELVSEACASAAPEAQRLGVELAMLMDSPAPALVDADILARAVDNLILNGLRFTPAGGQVAVSVGARGGAALIEIADNGLDIAEEDMSDLFEPGRPGPVSSRASLGAGFGLAVVKAVVAAHDGEVSVASGEGKGATFRISLPLADAALASNPRAPR